MSDHVYKSVEITGSSTEGVQAAIDNALAKASQSLRHIDWFEAVGIRGGIDGGTTYYQVTLKIGSGWSSSRGEHALRVLGELRAERAA